MTLFFDLFYALLYVSPLHVLLRGLPRALPHIRSLGLPLVLLIVLSVVLPIVLPVGRLFEVFQFRQLLQVLWRFRFAIGVAVNRIGLDVVLADHLGDRTDRLYVVVKVRDVQEAGLL